MKLNNFEYKYLTTTKTTTNEFKYRIKLKHNYTQKLWKVGTAPIYLKHKVKKELDKLITEVKVSRKKEVGADQIISK